MTSDCIPTQVILQSNKRRLAMINISITDRDKKICEYERKNHIQKTLCRNIFADIKKAVWKN
jgi:hypothetical protein